MDPIGKPLACYHFNAFILVVLPGKLKGALLQAFIIQNEATGFSAQQFCLVPSVVNENEHFSRSGIVLKLAHKAVWFA